jgi:uncharacterized protein with HEPN domain
MPKRPVKFLVEDILNNIQLVQEFALGLSYEEFLADTTKRYAIERGLGIIGEAVSKLPQSFTAKNNNVDWVIISGFRNRLVHEYFRLDYKIVWETIITDLPTLKQQLSEIKFDE